MDDVPKLLAAPVPVLGVLVEEGVLPTENPGLMPVPGLGAVLPPNAELAPLPELALPVFPLVELFELSCAPTTGSHMVAIRRQVIQSRGEIMKVRAVANSANLRATAYPYLPRRRNPFRWPDASRGWLKVNADGYFPIFTRI